MTIITVTVGFTERTNSSTRTHRGTGKEICEEMHIKEIDLNTVEIEVEQCDYYCNCRNSNTNTNTGSLATIEKLVDYNYDDTKKNKDKIKNVLDKISLLIENNKYAQIQKTLNKKDGYYDTYYAIKGIINDDTEYTDPEISFDENTGSSDDNEDKDNNVITNAYPFAVNFKKVDDVYVAKMHISDNLLNDIYITIKKDTDSIGSCCCFQGTYEHDIPTQLTLARPIKGDDNLSDHDHFYCYHKRYGKYEFNNSMSNY